MPQLTMCKYMLWPLDTLTEEPSFKRKSILPQGNFFLFSAKSLHNGQVIRKNPMLTISSHCRLPYYVTYRLYHQFKMILKSYLVKRNLKTNRKFWRALRAMDPDSVLRVLLLSAISNCYFFSLSIALVITLWEKKKLKLTRRFPSN